MIFTCCENALIASISRVTFLIWCTGNYLKLGKLPTKDFLFGLAALQAYFARIVPGCRLMSASKHK